MLFGVDYKLKSLGVLLKLKEEFFNTFSDGADGGKINRRRFTFSASRKFKGVGKIAIFYRTQTDLNVLIKKERFDVSKSILGFKYIYSLNLRKTKKSADKL